MSPEPSPQQDRTAGLPAGVREVAARLESEGHETWLGGESLLRVLLDQPPDAFELATSAPAERCLDLFPQAVPTHLERGVVTVPNGRVPIDVSSFRRGPVVTDDLAHRDFTVLAMAYRPATETFLDPHQGYADLEGRVLRCVGEPKDRFAEDPLRMLRAGRLVSEYGLAPQADLEAGIAEAADSWKDAQAPRLRRELSRLLLGDHPAEALGLLRRTGVESRLVRRTRSDSGALIATLPRNLPIRMAGWLRGTRPRHLLRQLRFGIARSQHVERLLEHHPLDTCVNPTRDRSLSRLLRQLDSADIQALFEIRDWELRHDNGQIDVAEARKRLRAVRSGIERIVQNRERNVRRTALALDGRAVMEILRCGPGNRVGAALRFAAELVASDPSCNDPMTLRNALLVWDAQDADKPKSTRGGPES